jgi:flagellar assembly protein FliH
MSILIKETDHSNTQRWELPSVEGDILPSSTVNKPKRPPTAEELEAIHKEAYEEGFNLGRKEGRTIGHKEGFELASREMQTRIDTLSGIINVLSEPLRQVDEEVEKSLTEMVHLIAKHLIRRELKTNEGEIIGVVRHVMSHLPISARNPRIHLNPEDIDLVKNALSIDDDKATWRLEADPLINRGGCLVETESSFIDATVEARIAAEVSQMLGGERQNDRDDEQR